MPDAESPATCSSANHGSMTIQQIMDCLPHRYPFLMIDRIEERVDNHMARGIRRLTLNEEFFQGHFPDDPEMPHSLLIEAMAQVGAAQIMTCPENRGRYLLFASLDNAEFGRPALPGDCLEITANMINYRREMGRTHIVCRVGKEEIASANFVFALSDLDHLGPSAE